MPPFLHAGPVRVRYESGFLRYFTLDGAEVLRMIYFAIRDRNWQTAKLIFTDVVIDECPDSFQIRYNWHTNELGIQIVGHVDIRGESDGTVTVDFYGKALNSFQKNRIGLCILHPIEGVLGQAVEVVRPDGRLTNGHFPTFISPHQPFLDIKTLRWQPASGVPLQLDVEGDVFETEDQRNWTDASFKTYSTPLERPFPVTVSMGEEFRQQVVFSLSKQALSAPVIVKGQAVEETKRVQNQLLIGVGQRANGQPMTATEAALLKNLQLSHLRADVFFSLPDWKTRLTYAISDAQQLSISLELAVFFGTNPIDEFRSLQHFLQSHTITVRHLLAFNAATLTTSNALLQTIIPVLRTDWPDVLIGGGTDDNFAELNRNRFDFSLVDFVTYSINPQVHAFDDLTLLENIAGQAETVLTARHISGGKPIHISPVTLLPRYTTIAGTATERQSAHADSRQTTVFGADWTRQSVETLTKAGVSSITYYESHGPAGLVNGDVAYPVYNYLLTNRQQSDT